MAQARRRNLAEPPGTRPGPETARQALAEARARREARRRLVLRHPDIAKRLTDAGFMPFPFGRPDQWTEYVPPATWGHSRNGSPRRQALLALVSEAERRGQGSPPAPGNSLLTLTERTVILLHEDVRR